VSFDDRVKASAERALLGVLQSRRDELKMRLEESSTEWALRIRSIAFIIRASRYTRSRNKPKRSSVCSRASRQVDH